MSLKNAKKVDTNRYELEVVIDGETFRKALSDVMRRESKKITVPGFRKGKAPVSFIEKYYGAEAFFQDTLDSLYGAALEEAAVEAGVEIVDDKMDFDLVSISKEDGVDFKVTLTVVPEIEIGEYKGLKEERLKVSVDDAEVEESVKAMADRNARVVAVEDRAAAMDDITVIDFDGSVDGVAFEGGKGEAYTLTLGSGQFIPGFEEQIVGKNIGEEFDVNVTFPTEYHAADLAGKEAVFKVKLHEIKKRELPEIDDEFAKDVSDFDTLAELKADLKAKALERKQKAAEDETETRLLDQIIDSIKGEIPEAMYNNRVQQNLRDLDYRLQSQGMSLENYIKYTGATIEDISKTYRPQAEKQVKMRLALEKIVKLENITVADEDVDKKYEEMAEMYSIPAEQVKAAVPAEELKKDIAVEKALDLVKTSAVITDVDAISEKAEKKPAAKKTSTAKKTEGDAEKKPAAKKTTSTTAKKTASTTKKAEGETAKKPAAKKTTSTAKKAEGDAEKKPAAKKTTTTKKTAAKTEE
ncbi:MAG: trigger factor [Ruminococcaceae bacterium]|nr:trigger factor [Oscillospiraceae bacterium]